MNDHDTKYIVEVTSGTIVRVLLFVLLLIVLYALRDVVLVVLTAVVLASAIEPVTNWFGRAHIPRIPAVISIYVFSAIFISTIVYFLLPPLLSDLASVISRMPEYVASVKLNIGESGLNLISPHLGDLPDEMTATELIREIRDAIGGDESPAFSIISTIFGGVFSFVLIIVISFYLAVQKNGIETFLRIVTPIHYENYIVDLWKRTQRKMGQWLQGQLILSVIVGLLSFLGLTIFGVPNALLLAILAGVLELIPLFGPFLAAIPAVALALIEGGFQLALIVVGLYVVIQQFENQLLHPLVVEKVVGVPAIIVIISILIGGTLAGFLGIILSVPIAAAIMEYLSDVQSRKRKLLDEMGRAEVT